MGERTMRREGRSSNLSRFEFSLSTFCKQFKSQFMNYVEQCNGRTNLDKLFEGRIQEVFLKQCVRAVVIVDVARIKSEFLHLWIIVSSSSTTSYYFFFA